VTDAGGRWTFDFPSGITWPFNFEHPSYQAVQQQVGTKLDIRLRRK